MTERRIAITGIGMITPCGVGWKPFWNSALKANSHIRPLQSISLNGFPSKFAGELTDFNPKTYVTQRKMLKLMSREIQIAVAASQLAVEDAGLEITEKDRERFGVSLGTGVINNDLDEVGVGIKNSLDENGEFQMKKFGSEGIRSLYPLWMLKYLPNMPACHISIARGLKGPSNTITTSAAAGAQAVGEAFRVIARGDADLMLAGSTDSKINGMGISRFHLLGLLSNNKRAPERAYAPFDQNHDGIVLGEGAGLLVLEEMDHAKARGAKIYAELAGYGSSSDFNYDPRTTRDYNGKRLAMARALEDASVAPNELDSLLAYGSGIPQEDIQESLAIQSVFNSSTGRLKVTGLKPVTGHLVYGSAGVEIAAAALSLSDGLIPPLANLNNPAVDCDLPFVKEKPQEGSRNCLFNSSGFGGQNASLVLKKR